MARKLASIVEIGELLPIEGADKIEVAIPKGKGWKIVVGKGEFHVGDLCVLFEIDSFINPNDERYAFLRDRCLRRFVSKSGTVLREGLKIKSMKLRGVVSQGLLMPLGAFIGKEIHYETRPAKPEDVVAEDGSPVTADDLEGMEVAELFYIKTTIKEGGTPECPLRMESRERIEVVPGTDLTELLHVEHYDEVKEQLQPAMGNPISADAMGRFPSDYIPKTDEERLANLMDWFETKKNRLWQVTEKADGSSTTCAYSPTIDADNPVIVCSRNLRLKRETAAGTVPVYWQMAEKYNMPVKLKEHYDKTGIELAIQFETVGPGINADKDKYTEHEGLVFRIYDITNQKFLNPDETVEFCKKNALSHVRVLETTFPFFAAVTSYDDAMKMAEGKTLRGNEREGIVCKTVDDGPYLSFKVVSNRYLLKQED